MNVTLLDWGELIRYFNIMHQTLKINNRVEVYNMEKKEYRDMTVEELFTEISRIEKVLKHRHGINVIVSEETESEDKSEKEESVKTEEKIINTVESKIDETLEMIKILKSIETLQNVIVVIQSSINGIREDFKKNDVQLIERIKNLENGLNMIKDSIDTNNSYLSDKMDEHNTTDECVETKNHKHQLGTTIYLQNCHRMTCPNCNESLPVTSLDPAFVGEEKYIITTSYTDVIEEKFSGSEAHTCTRYHCHNCGNEWTTKTKY